jgi:hypothetical protein
VSKENTTIIDGAGRKEDIEARVKQILRTLLDEALRRIDGHLTILVQPYRAAVDSARAAAARLAAGSALQQLQNTLRPLNGPAIVAPLQLNGCPFQVNESGIWAGLASLQQFLGLPDKTSCKPHGVCS